MEEVVKDIEASEATAESQYEVLDRMEEVLSEQDLPYIIFSKSGFSYGILSETGNMDFIRELLDFSNFKGEIFTHNNMEDHEAYWEGEPVYEWELYGGCLSVQIQIPHLIGQ
uniref:Uncharacterized protein n=1 Tax=Myoviridae sp. ctfrL10 TaxID=2826678 RepID=A0A8S5MRD7_9CAUD|nr:MAG TPA: hypothetical protein [Myoviridae sp. ctfrL10]